MIRVLCFLSLQIRVLSESTHCHCLNVNGLLAGNRRDILKFSDCSGTRTHNHLVRKRTLNHLVKLFWLNSWVFVYELNGCGYKSRWFVYIFPTVEPKFYRMKYWEFFGLLKQSSTWCLNSLNCRLMVLNSLKCKLMVYSFYRFKVSSNPYIELSYILIHWIHSVSLGIDPHSKQKPSNFLSPEALKTLTSLPRQTKSYDNSVTVDWI